MKVQGENIEDVSGSQAMRGENVGVRVDAFRQGQRADKLNATGAVASLMCAVHCALMPLLITLLPLVGVVF